VTAITLDQGTSAFQWTHHLQTGAICLPIAGLSALEGGAVEHEDFGRSTALTSPWVVPPAALL